MYYILLKNAVKWLNMKHMLVCWWHGKGVLFICVVRHNTHCYCSVEEAATDSSRSYETAILDQDYCATFRSARFFSQQVCRFYCANLHLIEASIKHLTFTYSTALLGAVVTLHQLTFKQYLLQILPAIPGILTSSCFSTICLNKYWYIAF